MAGLKIEAVSPLAQSQVARKEHVSEAGKTNVATAFKKSMTPPPLENETTPGFSPTTHTA